MTTLTAAGLPSVTQVVARLQALLTIARSIKKNSAVEPPLQTTDLLHHIDELHVDIDGSYDQTYRFAATETAAREIFYSLVQSMKIDDPAFVEVWNLLDILQACEDRDRCMPELVCYLIEELLDSQTTVGCRIVFDYLDSRRERLAAKDFHKKNLIFLRSCNELLRRLSRAEDAIFCGRVFFFLFQTFPLGDKSSVNLRGEFHTDNITKFEVPAIHAAEDVDDMDLGDDVPRPEGAVDKDPAMVKGEEVIKPGTPQPPAKAGVKGTLAKPTKKVPEEELLSNSELYPIFWRLQQDFCDPTRLFGHESFVSFKRGLALTIAKFKKTPPTVQTKMATDGKRGLKRKADGSILTSTAENSLVDNYNPKYLTSRDLFDLELSDLAFQRHIMVQALILIDFLLSLTEKAKKKFAGLEPTNRSMLYSFTMSEEDTTWAVATRTVITTYLQSVADGRFYCRMVETVLVRDKNWVRWKVESCPSIVKDPVSTEQEMAARKSALEAIRPRRVPNRPTGSMDLGFLSEGCGGGLEMLKVAARHTAPSNEQLLHAIENDQLDLEMAMDDAEKASLENAISNKKWRLLRQVRASRLGLLDQVEPGSKLSDIFKPPEVETADTNTADNEASPPFLRNENNVGDGVAA